MPAREQLRLTEARLEISRALYRHALLLHRWRILRGGCYCIVGAYCVGGVHVVGALGPQGEVPDGWNPDDVWAHHLTVYPADVHAKWCLFLPPHQLSAADRHPGQRFGVMGPGRVRHNPESWREIARARAAEADRSAA